MKYVVFSLSEEIILPETKRDGTKKRPKRKPDKINLQLTSCN